MADRYYSNRDGGEKNRRQNSHDGLRRTSRNSERKTSERQYRSISRQKNDFDSGYAPINHVESVREEQPEPIIVPKAPRKGFYRIGGITIKNGAFDYQFLFITIVLVAFGLIMLYSASSSRAYASTGDSLKLVKGQIGGLCVGLIAMIVCMNIDYHLIAKLSPFLYGIGIIMLILVLVPGVGTKANGATRWLFGFQPSEVVKFAMILIVALYMDSRQDKMDRFFTGFVPCLLLLGVVGVLLMLEPHFSATILITLTTMVMMYVGGARIKHFLYLVVPAVLGAISLVLTSEYRRTRLLSFMDPFADKQGAGWQIVQSLFAIGSGGVFGVGFGQSRQKYSSLPEPQNDFIFSVLSEELGWIGSTVVIVLFILLIYRGIHIAMKAPDMLGRVLATGCISIIGIQAIINIGVVTATFPVTGMPLPFFSYGGTALAITMAEIGLILNVSRQQKTL